MQGRRLSIALSVASTFLVLSGNSIVTQRPDTPLPIRMRSHTGQALQHSDLVDEARAVAVRLDGWLEGRPVTELQIEEVPWYDPRVGTGADAQVFVPQRALASPYDRAHSRALITGLAHLYWTDPLGHRESSLTSGIGQYIATRAIHEQLVGAHYFSVNVFGGFVTHVIRSVALSRLAQDPRPPLRQFPEMSDDPNVRRAVDAMYTLERYIGWPAVQHAIADWRQSQNGSVNEFEDSLWRATAQDLRWFTSMAFESSARFDYAVTEVTSTTASDGKGGYDTVVKVLRLGDATFPIDVETTFADGTRARERWDGKDPQATFQYRSRSAVTATVVDPDQVLLLDADRRNNVRVLVGRWHVPAIRWTMQWATWLQDMLLAATALI